MEATFTVTMKEVYEEVAQTTSYTGSKMDGDANAYERIFTTDEDQSQLKRFWDESCIAFCEAMKKYLASDTATYSGVQVVQPRGLSDITGSAVNPGIGSIVRPGLGESLVGEIIGHEFKLSLSQSFDTALLPSMRKELVSYFVLNITAKWYIFTNKKEADGYAAMAADLLDGLRRKACYKKKPTRPTYD